MPTPELPPPLPDQPTSAAEAERERDAYRRQLETIAENATLALFIMDERQRCTFMNPAAERLTGFTLAELRGRALHYHVHHTRPDGRPYPLEECPIDRAFPQNMREQGEEVFVHKDGTFYEVAFTASPIRETAADGSRRTVGTIVEVRDIRGEKARERERERLISALEAERARLSDVFRQAPVAVVVVRGVRAEALVFELVNPRYLEMLPPGRAPLGRRVRDVLPEAPGLLPVLQRVLDTGSPFVAQEYPVPLDRDGDGVPETYFFSFVYHPFLGADGRPAGIVGVATEVTESVRARYEAERLRGVAEAARADAEAANRAKADFLAVMSHELRTPLNAIGGYAELLALELRGPLTAAQHEDLARLLRANQHLTSLVTDVLNFARLEAGRVEFHLEPVALVPLLADLETSVAPEVTARQLTFTRDVRTLGGGASAPAPRADREKLRQVLLNLVTNAIKFTEPGGRVTLRCEADPVAGLVHLRVEDTGRGIDPEALSRIFDPFVQVERHRTRGSQQGIGLGLAISRDLARGMGGDLTVTSRPGVGSTFTVTLPLAARRGER